MDLIYNKIFLKHYTGDHVENKRRLEAFGRLREIKVINGERYLRLIHPKGYLDYVKERGELSGFLDLETTTSRQSYKVACFAVGASIMASEGKDFALIRPPGHHAGFEHGGGFCLLNNIAIATKRLVDENKKVFILDFDGHFGNGTAEIFYSSKDVLYLSLHQYPAYPGKGWITEIGSGEGKGYTINIPLPPKSGDDLFIQAIRNFIPLIKQFNPDVVAVSAGFDGHHSDPLLELKLSMNSFYKIGRILSGNFDNIFAVLEGGYDLNFLPKCVYNFLAGINRKKIRFIEDETISNRPVIREYNQRMKSLKKLLSKYWKF